MVSDFFVIKKILLSQNLAFSIRYWRFEHLYT